MFTRDSGQKILIPISTSLELDDYTITIQCKKYNEPSSSLHNISTTIVVINNISYAQHVVEEGEFEDGDYCFYLNFSNEFVDITKGPVVQAVRNL